MWSAPDRSNVGGVRLPVWERDHTIPVGFPAFICIRGGHRLASRDYMEAWKERYWILLAALFSGATGKLRCVCIDLHVRMRAHPTPLWCVAS